MSSNMHKHTNNVISALGNAPGFETIKAEDCKITRLGGMTNHVHLVETKDANIDVRITGEGTEDYINRATELTNATAAWRAGISPEVIWADVKTGVMISRAIDEIETMTPALFSTRLGSPTRAGEALAKLHNSGETFDFRFELFTMIADYLKVLSTKDVELPDGYHDIVKAANPVKEVLEASPMPLAPCHCDPLCENFLDDGKSMWIVDWEYSGMNDPLWDLGDLSVEAGMNESQEAELLSAYFGADPTAAQKGRVIIYKAMCDLLWTLWGLIQLADGNPADDFWVYAKERFERCKALMQKKLGGRLIVFLAGPPGSGKTALTALWEDLTKQGIIDVPLQPLPMDGFHYPNDFLDQKNIIVNGRELPLRKIKGSPETFNLKEIQARLSEVRSGKPSYWPVYDRQLHDPVTDAISVIDNGILVLEGNYLLLDEIGWRELHRHADKLIFINGPESIMQKNVVKRHQRGGLSLEESIIRYNLVDHQNYKLVNTNLKEVNTILQIDENCNIRLVS